MPEKFEVVPFYREEEYEIWLKKKERRIRLLDSLSMVNLIMYVEVQLGRRIDRKDFCMENLRSVSRMRAFLFLLD